MKKLPPYGAKLAQALAEGNPFKNSVYCFCGQEAWQRAAESARCRPTLCLPFQADPRDYAWPVCNCDILIYESGGLQPTQIERFIYYLLRHNALIVRLLTSDFKQLFVYRR